MSCVPRGRLTLGAELISRAPNRRLRTRGNFYFGRVGHGTDGYVDSSDCSFYSDHMRAILAVFIVVFLYEIEVDIGFFY